MEEQQSAEYITLRRCYKKLLNHIEQCPNIFCDAMFAEGYIPSEVRNYIRDESVHIQKIEKARKLLDTMIDRVEHDPLAYNRFVKIFEDEGPWGKCVTEELNQCYISEKDRIVQEQEQIKRKSSNAEQLPSLSWRAEAHVSKTKTVSNAVGFICPYCKKCTVEEFFSRAGCPEINCAENTSLFPFLDKTALSDQDREDLEAKLVSDTTDIISLFAHTENFIITSLVSKRSSDVTLILNYVLNLVARVGRKEDETVLRKAQSIPSIFLGLHPYKSFFNYEIIQSVVAEFGSPKDRDKMREYVDAFNIYCRRSVFEVPPDIFRYQIRNSEDKVFSVKFTPEDLVTLGDVVMARRKIARILDVKVGVLQLCSIEKGCVCLRFLIPAHVADKIFPLTPSQQTALRDIHIRVLEEHASGSKPSADQRQPPDTWKSYEQKRQLSLLLLEVCQKGLFSKVSYLIEQGANIDYWDYQRGTTPLIAACEGGHLATVQLLIEKGADVSKYDKKGRTPIQAASEGGHSDTVQLLVANGASRSSNQQHQGSLDRYRANTLPTSPISVPCQDWLPPLQASPYTIESPNLTRAKMMFKDGRSSITSSGYHSQLSPYPSDFTSTDDLSSEDSSSQHGHSSLRDRPTKSRAASVTSCVSEATETRLLSLPQLGSKISMQLKTKSDEKL